MHAPGPGASLIQPRFAGILPASDTLSQPNSLHPKHHNDEKSAAHP